MLMKDTNLKCIYNYILLSSVEIMISMRVRHRGLRWNQHFFCCCFHCHFCKILGAFLLFYSFFYIYAFLLIPFTRENINSQLILLSLLGSETARTGEGDLPG